MIKRCSACAKHLADTSSRDHNFHKAAEGAHPRLGGGWGMGGELGPEFCHTGLPSLA